MNTKKICRERSKY